jgi:Tol biopolymer transport system component
MQNLLARIAGGMSALFALLIALLMIGRAPVSPFVYAYLPDPDERVAALYLHEPGCADWFSVCEAESRRLMDGLHPYYPASVWSPDGRWIALRSADQRWLIYEAACLLSGGACPSAALSSQWNDIRLTWGRNGEIALARAGALHILTPECPDDGSAGMCEWVEGAQASYNPALSYFMADWSADGRALALTSMSGRGEVVWLDAACLDSDAETCFENAEFYRTRNIPYWVALSPDGERVVYAAAANPRVSRSQLYLIERATGETRMITRVGEEAVLSDWSPDGRMLVYASSIRIITNQIDIALLDVERGVYARVVRDTGWNLYPSWGTPLQ